MNSESIKAFDALAEMWGRLDEVRRRNGLAFEDVPNSAFTASEYAKRYGLVYGAAAAQLRRLCKQGALESGVAYRPNSSGKLVATNVFWVAGAGGATCANGSSSTMIVNGARRTRGRRK